MYPEDPVTSDALRASVTLRFDTLARRLALPLGATVDLVESEDFSVLKITPANDDALAIDVVFDNLIDFAAGSIGGRWEADYTDEMVEDLEDLLHAIVAGHVSEVAAPGRSRVEVTIASGEVVSETGYEGCLTSLTPMPGWTKWGRRLQYGPYRPSI
ncbi:hypothetical protein [Demequina mangrovi]|uniref:Uncharacterized protein n=1 Tax=Demequina mangrovi TaxID=1043493 RepID=A0A1H6U9K2_9MICO|nr:hypothetical protein [Demequina mangrovi]SEI88226.1 hypothetical protein SAMN05421637_0294 [Demequina mangrovi]